MAKLFYSASEAAERLGKTEEEVKALVREGKLREFRDAGAVNYKVEDVDKLADQEKDQKPAPQPPPKVEPSAASASGEIILEPADESGVELAGSMSDIISLEESETGEESSGTTAVGKSKEDTVVPSVGVNVFDDEELDEHVDPLAQTAVTDLAGLGLEGSGSGSGILELTRESDDTSLGKELLEEIYTDEEAEGEQPVEMGEGTRAGLEEAPAESEAEFEPEPAARPEPRAAAVQAVEYAPDALSTSLTALMVVGVAILGVAGLATAALARGISPPLIEILYERLWMFAAGALVVGGLAAAVTYLVARRSGEG